MREHGDHNGKNYIAYTFYVENTGKENINYWYEVIVDDVVPSALPSITVV